MTKIKLKEGDVFTIPLGNGEIGFGQLVCFPRNKYVFIMCVFDYKQTINESYNIEVICKSSLLFLGYSNDAKLYHNDWVVIGNYTKNIDEIILPYNRLGTPPNDIYIVNYKGERLKEINEAVFNQLSYETEIAPIRYENALKAYYKLQEWKAADYDKLLYKNVLKSKSIFEHV